ncbi:hypothetical protein [Desulfobacter hydrogenophilus]|nr:hypothetical protein [Desulfobacter hydrogenophilus]NDY74460.1 hypothetical protein [Desulfobacter hydrogenophilus]QBH14298.1 hypothetical protein EYB58_16070 [Desulfobacter hydrogenophilus]
MKNSIMDRLIDELDMFIDPVDYPIELEYGGRGRDLRVQEKARELVVILEELSAPEARAALELAGDLLDNPIYTGRF